MAKPQEKQELIDLTSLPLPTLKQVRTQLDEEISVLSNSFSQLKRAQSTFADCGSCLQNLKGAEEDQKMLIPLTSSLYVPGQVKDIEKVIIDVGTGYYVEKTLDEGIKYFDEKTEFIGNGLKDLEQNITGKQSNMDVVLQVINMKTQQAQQAQAKQN
ncbi:Prefoldin alpha subunit [Conidiobolus coronatus NRRL 28638]|uniref:Prefoldin alpha subunit n=1 Tax=Conidiobolus coronatus (strain ATCC 28846 / CBS 209.66 / NRRL 28638) TaxID=796925 RepID=A0A137PGP0_CONC2|nr:Prefoldin alpha subunit [Conidiobolus coronatus NRRL 28638]|eukprot:KXN74140.1 Prefoldin alpha subunit [Conidiobolus coronatus NRRL 28638]